MTRRYRILAWSITCTALLGILLWAYRRYVLLHPDPTLSWIHGGVTLNPMFWPARQLETLNVEAIYRFHPRFRDAGFRIWFGVGYSEAILRAAGSIILAGILFPTNGVRW